MASASVGTSAGKGPAWPLDKGSAQQQQQQQQQQGAPTFTMTATIPGQAAQTVHLSAAAVLPWLKVVTGWQAPGSNEHTPVTLEHHAGACSSDAGGVVFAVHGDMRRHRFELPRNADYGDIQFHGGVVKMAKDTYVAWRAELRRAGARVDCWDTVHGVDGDDDDSDDDSDDDERDEDSE